jgi:predicted GH43/DUF377 family glycosyl hydrolase
MNTREFRLALFAALSLAILGEISSVYPSESRQVTLNKSGFSVLAPESFSPFINLLNENDRELYSQHIPNSAAWEFLSRNIPLLDCPDKEIQETYYFRWWTFRKHIKRTADGFIVTEFLPQVSWAGKENSINCAAGHHLHEGRWLADAQYLDDYSMFWFRKGGDARRYSFWAADSIWARYLVSADARLPKELLPDLIKNYEAWEKEHRDADGLYWQVDGQDGMEVSISGALHPRQEGYRVTLNSYQYGDALAIAQIADSSGETGLAATFRAKATEIKRLIQQRLWDSDAQFFKVLPRSEGARLSDARELHGYTPWYFDLPDPDKSIAWRQLVDPLGFFAPYGPTTAEQRHSQFALSYQGHECQWNGPSWPYSTSVTLTGLANLLNDYQQEAIDRDAYVKLLQIYAKSHRLRLPDGRSVPWIDENLNPRTGDWISRTRLQHWKNGTWDAEKGGVERGKDYNHSTFCDLVITGLVGLRPRADEKVTVNPLVPQDWDYFCLDHIRYHGRWLTVLWDRTGQRYHQGSGLRLMIDGQTVAVSDTITRLQGELPAQPSPGASQQNTARWKKYPGNPVLGGQYGTCFDVSVMAEASGYRMYVSWRPKQSIAVVESSDGINWSGPPRIVLGPRKQTGWEDDINRPVVLKRSDGYHMWYTGQTKEHSWIGYATSTDGLTWTRMSDQPVLSPEKPWEKVAVMCPHVIWDESTQQYRMWYSGGEQYEPDAIGYATSPDGLSWTRSAQNPVFTADPSCEWEKHKVTACQVVPQDGGYLMFYIGFRDVDHAQIGVARSPDGISHWQRHHENPIVSPGANQWDHDACYKPYAIYDGRRWLLWYNGRHDSLEQIGVAFHEGKDLGFFAPKTGEQVGGPVAIGSRLEMMVDHWLIDSNHTRGNISLQLQTPVKREVVLETDRPWEGPDSAYFTVFQDGARVRLYYRGMVPTNDWSENQVTCYAESSDGIHFTRPDLGLVDFQGSKANNIIYRGLEAHNFAPFRDENPAVQPAQLYKALGGIGGKLYAFVSPDGIRWQKLTTEPVMTQGAFDSLNLAFWDAQIGNYRSYSRYFADGVRAIQSCTSTDFVSWSAPKPNLYGPNVPREHFYTSATRPCPGAPHLYLAFPKRFVPERKKWDDYREPGVSDAVFISSRDGENWDRTFQEAWVRPGRDKRNWTQRSNMPAWGIVQLSPDEFSMYITEHYGWPDHRLRRITVRRHGFAAMHADARGGEFTTRPITFNGKYLVLNYSTSAAGSIQVELQNELGQAVTGYALGDMTPLFGDELDAEVHWNSGRDLSNFIGKPVRFRFLLKDADLFALRLSAFETPGDN